MSDTIVSWKIFVKFSVNCDSIGICRGIKVCGDFEKFFDVSRMEHLNTDIRSYHMLTM